MKNTNHKVRLIGFFERHDTPKGEDLKWDKMMKSSPNEIVTMKERNDDPDHPFFWGGDDGGETPCEWLTEDEYSIGEGLLENGGRKEYTLNADYLVCYEPAEGRIEIYQCEH